MNSIKTLRESTQLSQSKFAKKFDIPLRTLQKWEQQDSDPSKYLESFIQEKLAFEENISISKYMIPHSNVFEQKIDDGFTNISHVHPIQQKRIKTIIDVLKEFPEVKKIIVFGSSTTYKCNYESDIDIYVKLSKKINVEKFDIDCPVDFWTNYTVTKEMIEEIKKKGVVVYDC